jgi:hypothetical protein
MSVIDASSVKELLLFLLDLVGSLELSLHKDRHVHSMILHEAVACKFKNKVKK